MKAHTVEFRNAGIGRRHALLESVSCQADPGDLVILTGENGCGKSTLLKTLAGLLPLLSGEILIRNRALSSMKHKELSYVMAFAGTERVREDYLTVEDMVRYGRFPFAAQAAAGTDDAIVSEAMALMGIADKAGITLDKISDGEWQKANIARALAQETPLILLDEPAAFLDYPSRIRLMKDLLAICREKQKTIVVSTHDIETAHRYGSLFWHIDKGRLISSKQPLPWEL